MFKNQFMADNSRFGAALASVLDAYEIGVSEFLDECKVQYLRVINVKKV